MRAEFPTPEGFRLVGCAAVPAGEGRPARVIHPDPGLRLTFAPAAAIAAAWYELELIFPPEGLVDAMVEFAFAGGDALALRLQVTARNRLLGHFRLQSGLQQLTVTLTGSGRLDQPTFCRFARIRVGEHLALAARRGLEILRRDGFGVFWSGLNYLRRLMGSGSIAVARGPLAATGEAPYETWIQVFDEAPEAHAARHAERLAALPRRPLISILTTLRSPASAARFASALARQIYSVWELVVATDAQHRDGIVSALAAAGLDVASLRVVDAGAHAAESANAALAVAQGEFVLPIVESAVLRPHALLELAMTLAQQPSARLIYADEDRIDAAGSRSDWRFRPAWSPTWFEARDYLGTLTLLRRATIWELGGWRAEAADPRYDLLSRVAAAQADDIVHLAKILVHATAEQARPVRPAPARHVTPSPRVSIIIPTRDGAGILSTCIRSIRARTRYPDYEIIIVDNGSVKDETKQLFAALSADPAIRILPRPEPFNFSRLNNAAVREAAGSVLALVNNDIEVTRDDWLDAMVSLAMRPDTGCVGAKLLYPDGRLQHAGVVIGLGGVAGHAHRFAPGNAPGYLGRLRAAHEVSAVTAACLVIRRSVFEAVGGFEEGLAVAFNDVDFCLKVRAAGYRNVWTPFAELIHHESVSRGRDLTPSKARRFAAEYVTMQRRWGAQLLSDPYYSPHLTYDREDFSLRLR